MRISNLDSLRGISAFVVLMFHYPSDLMPGLLNNFIIRSGFVFVDLFFVISGFIMVVLYGSGDTNIYIFLKKRFSRVYPLLLITTLVFFSYYLLLYFFGEEVNISISSADIKYKFQEVVDTLLLLNSSRLYIDTMGVNIPSWSISAEFVSYLLFAIMLRINGKRVFTIFLLILSGLTLYIGGHYYLDSSGGWLRCIFGFFIGVIVGRCWLRWPIQGGLVTFSTIILIVTSITYMVFINDSQHGAGSLSWPFILTLMFGVLVHQIAGNERLNFLDNRVTLFLGRISYSLYLWHFLFMRVITQIMLKILKYDYSGLSLWFILAIYVLVTLFWSHWSNKYLEQYLQKKLRKWMSI